MQCRTLNVRIVDLFTLKSYARLNGLLRSWRATKKRYQLQRLACVVLHAAMNLPTRTYSHTVFCNSLKMATSTTNGPASSFEEMKNKILLKRAALEAAIETLTYQIDHWRQWSSKAQIWVWRVRRYNLRKQLETLPTEKMLQEGAKRINYSNTMPKRK